MKRCLVLILGLLTVGFGACSRQTTAPATSPTAATSDSAPAAGAGTMTAANSATSSAAAGSGPETTEGSDDAPVGTTSLDKIADLPAQHQLPDGKWKAGVNYDPVVPSQPTSVAAGKVEVLEVFWY